MPGIYEYFANQGRAHDFLDGASLEEPDWHTVVDLSCCSSDRLDRLTECIVQGRLINVALKIALSLLTPDVYPATQRFLSACQNQSHSGNLSVVFLFNALSLDPFYGILQSTASQIQLASLALNLHASSVYILSDESGAYPPLQGGDFHQLTRLLFLDYLPAKIRVKVAAAHVNYAVMRGFLEATRAYHEAGKEFELTLSLDRASLRALTESLDAFPQMHLSTLELSFSESLIEDDLDVISRLISKLPKGTILHCPKLEGNTWTDSGLATIAHAISIRSESMTINLEGHVHQLRRAEVFHQAMCRSHAPLHLLLDSDLPNESLAPFKEGLITGCYPPGSGVSCAIPSSFPTRVNNNIRTDSSFNCSGLVKELGMALAQSSLNNRYVVKWSDDLACSCVCLQWGHAECFPIPHIDLTCSTLLYHSLAATAQSEYLTKADQVFGSMEVGAVIFSSIHVHRIIAEAEAAIYRAAIICSRSICNRIVSDCASHIIHYLVPRHFLDSLVTLLMHIPSNSFLLAQYSFFF